MAYHYPNLTLSLNSSTQPRRGITHTVDDLSTQLEEDPNVYEAQLGAASARGNNLWSTLNPLNLRPGERFKTGPNGRAALQPPNSSESTVSRPRSSERARTPELDDQQAFSLIGASVGARLCLSQMPPDTHPQTVVWACPQPAWGQWPCHTLEYCISVLTEPEARALYLFTPSPLPPVYECTLDGVVHLWLVVPSHLCVDGVMQLNEGQLHAAVEFYERTGAAATACDAGTMLLTCTYGHEVDTVGLAVLLLGCHCYDHNRGPRRGGHGAKYGGSGPGYRASRLIDDDPGVSYVWKGLLGWQDVERVEAVLREGVSYKMNAQGDNCEAETL
jgi:hypothetical protein